MSAYCQWLPESVQEEVAKAWPPLWRRTWPDICVDPLCLSDTILHHQCISSAILIFLNVLSKCIWNTTLQGFVCFRLYPVSRMCADFQHKNISRGFVMTSYLCADVIYIYISILVFTRPIKLVCLSTRFACFCTESTVSEDTGSLCYKWMHWSLWTFTRLMTRCLFNSQHGARFGAEEAHDFRCVTDTRLKKDWLWCLESYYRI